MSAVAAAVVQYISHCQTPSRFSRTKHQTKNPYGLRVFGGGGGGGGGIISNHIAATNVHIVYLSLIFVRVKTNQLIDCILQTIPLAIRIALIGQHKATLYRP